MNDMLIASFLDYLRFEKVSSEQTVSAYEVDLNQFKAFVKSIDEEVSLLQVDADWIRQWQMSLLEKKDAPATVNRKLSSLRSFYKFLRIREKIKVDPMQKIASVKQQKKLPVFLRESEMDRLLDDVNFSEDYFGCRDQLILETFYMTGMRLAELVGLRLKDVDVDQCVVRVIGKRNKQRLIPFGDELKNLFQNYLKMRKNSFEELTTVFLFLNKNGDQISRSDVQLMVKRYLSKVVTLRQKSPHVLRHTFATAMLNGNASLSAVKELLGHASLSATEIYTHVSFEEMKKVYKQAHPRA